MLDRWFGVKVHHYLHVLGMMVLAFGLPMNKVLMSIGAIWGISNLVLEAKFASYWQNIKSNRTYLLLLGFFLLHIIALFWSDNLSYGLHDLRIKLPIFAVPLALVAHPISSKKEIHLILLTFLSSLLICSGFNFNYFLDSISVDSPEKFREMSLFGSHIRFAVLIVIGAVISFYFAWKVPKFRILFIVLTFWFLVYTFYSQVISGMLSLFGALLFLLLYLGWKYKLVRFASITLMITSIFLSISFIQSLGNGNLKNSSVNLEKLTAQGHVYYHDTVHPVFEQGRYIYIHISDEELEKEWPKYSKLDYNGKDRKNHTLKETLFRYMTAKDLKKDAEGLSKLSKKDIRNIENGVPSPLLLKKGLLSRLTTIRYQIENANNPNGQSLLQRIEYWKTGTSIIKENPIIGVGTGDVQDAFNEQYLRNKTILQPEYWFRAHNMFLTVQISFGILGSILFLLFLLSFLRKNYDQRNILAVCLFGVIIVSFFIEDTLETQTGVTLFSLFFGLFLFDQQKVDLEEEEL
jgi:hypothetical protein|tara:strand:- start:14946 stop:16502 length:1557 start_codon:yes stop_codon:yes gene_type:complete